ncbi:MAG: 23S rRNA (adenine(2503)-C(2))-methyltransferase RlmN [Patescibacteria group bacterium]
MDLNKLENFLKENNQPKFRLDQIRKAVYADGVSLFSEIYTISKDLRELLDKEIKILSFKAEKVLISDDKKSIKALLKLLDNSCIETVLLSPRPDTWTACISSQIGCPLGCAFCATGKGGFKRNLTAEEITDQVLFWKQYLYRGSTSIRGRTSELSNIVYMGMGEPFLNWENVKKSVEDLINPKLFNFGSRSISISTAGVKGGIEKFLEEFPQVNLAISLHFTDDEMRSKYMPANKAYNLEDIKKDLQNYFKKSKRKVFIEYIMFDGLNDDIKDADKLIKYLNSIGNSYLLHVNLISYNMEYGTPKENKFPTGQAYNKNLFKSSEKNQIEKFRNYLLQNKINATIRKSQGSEIRGSCGQLAGN